MTAKKGKIAVRQIVPDDPSVAPDVLQRVGIEFHDPASCTCEECVALRQKRDEEERNAA